MKSRIPEITHSTEETKDLPPTIFLYSSGYDEEYVTKHYVDHYTHQPSVSSWVPFQSLTRYYWAYWYDTQIMTIFCNVFNPYLNAITKYKDAFCESVDVASYKYTETLWKDYTAWLMKELPEHEEVKKDFDDIPEKLHGATNEKRLKEFYKREMEMLKENYENERPERILYDIEVLTALGRLAENDGATSSERFEDWEIPYGKYFVKVGLIALLQTVFVFVGYWKLVERSKESKK
ncbi:MAG: hypothetical protein U9N35_00955 [Euryarchaeota archaeon]|nr:hypothetical protein [Euryarchaeota archaeon]